jgi:hypothetical protein
MIIGFFELSEAVKLDKEKGKEKEETHDSILHKCSKKTSKNSFQQWRNIDGQIPNFKVPFLDSTCT